MQAKLMGWAHMLGRKLYALGFAIIRAWSKLLNWTTGGPKGWTFSARSYRSWLTARTPFGRVFWWCVSGFIDMIFLIPDGPNHTYRAWKTWRQKQ